MAGQIRRIVQVAAERHRRAMIVLSAVVVLVGLVPLLSSLVNVMVTPEPVRFPQNATLNDFTWSWFGERDATNWVVFLVGFAVVAAGVGLWSWASPRRAVTP